jgi:hypothetical protein
MGDRMYSSMYSLPRQQLEVSGKVPAPADYPPGKDPGSYWTEGWVGPTTGLDEVEEKILPYRESNCDISTVQPVAIPAA